MKRSTALRNVRTICDRLDQINSKQYRIVPLKLYLYGSVVTDKPDPGDLDLLLVYQDHRKPEEVVQALTYRQFDSLYRLSVDLRRGMRGVHMEVAAVPLEEYPFAYFYALDANVRLIWKSGLDWQAILNDVELQPSPWQGPRAPDAKEQLQAAHEAASDEEKDQRIRTWLAALAAQEANLPTKLVVS